MLQDLKTSPPPLKARLCGAGRLPSIALLAGVLAVAAPAGGAHARDADDARLKAVQDQIASLQNQLDTLTRALAASRGAAAATPAAVAVPPAALAQALKTPPPDASAPGRPRDGRFIERKPGDGLTFLTNGGDVTAYGVFDVAFEGATKGMGALRLADGTRPVGAIGWMPDISTNLSALGVRGEQAIAGGKLQFIYQLETQIEISASSGVGETNSNQSNVVKGGLTSRNSFIGLAAPGLGALEIGKTDAPYKQSTARMNPFVGMLGDYASIMGNTGGDNRVEFGTRLDHALWYRSPDVFGLTLDALFSPGQNRASDSDNIAAGESDCTGGNVPGSGGSLPIACNDGAFSDAVSVSLAYRRGPLYLVAAYERHSKVNRSSDLTGEYASPPADFFTADTADEDAAKVGVQVALPMGATVSGVFETLHRYVPAVLAFQNERQRTGYWLSATKEISRDGSLAIGWAHASRTPGDPGQHNTSTLLPPLGSPGDGVGGAGVDNAADMITAAYKLSLGGGLSAYVNWALILNGPYAHYALGAGGRAVTIDCHDASDASGGLASNPHCWAGAKPQGVSTGLQYKF